jgi:hypothetical protein
LYDERELSSAIRLMRWSKRGLADVIVTEFCDTADATGLYRKYSSFCVDGCILPRHVFFSDEWMIKQWKLLTESSKQEEADYLAANPHAALLRELFAVARVDYGRVDYSLLDGQLQVWEINTNPMIIASGQGGGGARSEIHAQFAASMQAVLESLAAYPSGGVGLHR